MTVRHLRSMMTHPSHFCHHPLRSFDVDGHLSQSERVGDGRGRRKSCHALDRFDRYRGREDVAQSRSR